MAEGRWEASKGDREWLGTFLICNSVAWYWFWLEQLRTYPNEARDVLIKPGPT